MALFRSQLTRLFAVAAIALIGSLAGPSTAGADGGSSTYCASTCTHGFTACGTNMEGAVCAYVGCWGDNGHWYPYYITCPAAE
jgi:hypothetical protein